MVKNETCWTVRTYNLGVKVYATWNLKTFEGHGNHPGIALELTPCAGRDSVCWLEMQKTC